VLSINIARKRILNARAKDANTKNKLGQKNFEEAFTHELLHVFFDSIGFHDKLVTKFKTRANEKLVDGLAQHLYPMLRPTVFKIPNHCIRSRIKIRD